MHYRVFVAAKQLGRAQQKVVKKIDHPAHAAANDGVNERLAEPTFPLHCGECFSRFVKTIIKVSKKPRRIPRCCRSSQGRPDRGAIVAVGVMAPPPVNCGCGVGAPLGRFLARIGNLRKRLPGWHPFAPAKIRAGEFSAAQSFAHFIFPKMYRDSWPLRLIMKSSHRTRVLRGRPALVSSAEVSAAFAAR